MSTKRNHADHIEAWAAGEILTDTAPADREALKEYVADHARLCEVINILSKHYGNHANNMFGINSETIKHLRDAEAESKSLRRQLKAASESREVLKDLAYLTADAQFSERSASESKGYFSEIEAHIIKALEHLTPSPKDSVEKESTPILCNYCKAEMEFTGRLACKGCSPQHFER